MAGCAGLPKALLDAAADAAEGMHDQEEHTSTWDSRLTAPLLQLYWDQVVNGNLVGDDAWAGEFFALWQRLQQTAMGMTAGANCGGADEPERYV